MLSGNRNFEGRINPDVKMNYLASPPLVVAYALAGTMDFDFDDRAARHGPGRQRRLPARHLAVAAGGRGDDRRRRSTRRCSPSDYADVFAGDERWQSLPTPDGRHVRVGRRLDLRAQAAVLRRHDRASRRRSTDIAGARVLAMLGDSVTTDHITPAGSIKADSPAGHYLAEHGVDAQGLQLLRLAARQPRGDDPRHVRQHPAAQPARSTASRAASPATSPAAASSDARSTTPPQPTPAAGIPLVVLAGKEYGSGSSRDWAAKGTALLGVRAVIAESYERIHRSNLIGMGVLPLQFPDGRDRRVARPRRRPRPSTITGVTALNDGTTPQTVHVRATKADADDVEFDAVLRIDTPGEADYYRHGGILQYVLRSLVELTAPGRRRESAPNPRLSRVSTVARRRHWQLPRVGSGRRGSSGPLRVCRSWLAGRTPIEGDTVADRSPHLIGTVLGTGAATAAAALTLGSLPSAHAAKGPSTRNITFRAWRGAQLSGGTSNGTAVMGGALIIGSVTGARPTPTSRPARPPATTPPHGPHPWSTPGMPSPSSSHRGTPPLRTGHGSRFASVRLPTTGPLAGTSSAGGHPTTPTTAASINRTSQNGQATAYATVYTDTLAALNDHTLRTWQLEVTLLRRAGTTVVPRSLVAAMASGLPGGQEGAGQRSGSGVRRGGGPRPSRRTRRSCTRATTRPTTTGERPGARRPRRPWSLASGAPARARPTPPDHAAARRGGRPRRAECLRRPLRRLRELAVQHGVCGRYGLEGFVTRLRSLAEAELFVAAGIRWWRPSRSTRASSRGPGFVTQRAPLVIRGFTPSGDVVVNDPASHLIADDAQVRVVYDRGQFENVWVPHSGGIVYVIRPRRSPLPGGSGSGELVGRIGGFWP